MVVLDEGSKRAPDVRWLRATYPAMFATFPIIGVAANNPGYYRLIDVLVLCLIAIVAVAVLYGIAYAFIRTLTRSDSGPDVAALVSLVAIALFYFYGPLPLGAVKGWAVAHPVYSLAIVVAIAMGCYFAKKRGMQRKLPAMSTVSRFLALTGGILVCVSIGRLAYDEISDIVAIHRSELARDLARPVPMRVAGVGSDGGSSGGALTPKRDIYIILLDEYAATDVYRERYGYDNRPFEDSLRALGFHIPRDLRSNYANTLLSITSLLNFAQIQPIANVMSPGSKDFTPVAYLMEHNRTERFLKSQGYRFVFFPSAWYSPTRANSDADEEYDPYKHFSLARAMRRSWIAQYFAGITMFSKLRPRMATENEVDAEHEMRDFAGIPSIAADPRLTFTFVHVLMPHLGYKVDSTCAPLVRSPGITGLSGELHCLNYQTLKMVHALIAKSSVQPIIILQGDHGSQSLKQFVSYTALPNTDQARERFRPFGAYYLPGSPAGVIPDSTSIVNVLRYVFDYYFNTDLKPLPNTMYYSHWMYPYRMTEVDANFHVVRQRAAPGK